MGKWRDDWNSTLEFQRGVFLRATDGRGGLRHLSLTAILSIVTDFSPGFGIDDPRCAEDVTSWCREFAPETQVAILRVFYEVGDETMPQIQVVNFAPNLLKSENYYDASVPDQRGKPLSRRNLYESHTNSLAKFNEWLNRKAQSGEEITILGMQTVLQPTRAISALTSTSWEHLDAEETIFPSNLCKKTLESVKMLRVFYSGSVSDDSLSGDSRNNPRVSCRSFFPENPREDLSYELWQRATSFARDKQLKAGFLRLETVKTVVSTPEATLPMDYGSASLCFDKTANTFWVTGFVLYFYSLGGREDSLGSVASGGEEIDVEQCVSDKKPQQHRKRFSGRCIVA
ncbi:unnamed protein product [Notodromas monacha]|uniref:Uncharacterized protein n=1 Tax=Notodromas monacha TaxID=399045 RepID=A0A7R9GK20_9CRUS|nr:unnamed protein product [Notodromas monacha]CAG0923410.1 unnamed protein product [Notodromas monacha]